MKDYVRAYDNPTNVYYTEARRLADKLRTDTILTLRGIQRGVLRWKGSDAVVSENAAKLAYALGIRVCPDACRRIRG